GSREAYTALYSHYYPGVHRFVSFVTKSPEDTEEIIQDIFLKVWLKREVLIGIRSFENYLFRMAKNRIFDMARQSGNRYKLAKLMGQHLQETEDSTYNALVFQEYHDIAQTAISILPARKKQIFLMNTCEEMTAREIAEELGTTRTAVKKQLYEAIHLVKDHLRRHAQWHVPLLFLYFTC
ncbi:MAG: sigma-70 family RNA polymerase sigma factor, partial [Chitinophaga rupis]